MTYQTTESQADAETRSATAAAAMLAGERWAARPDTTHILRLMSVAGEDGRAATADWAFGAQWADRELAHWADEAESRAVLAAVLARRVDE